MLYLYMNSFMTVYISIFFISVYCVYEGHCSFSFIFYWSFVRLLTSYFNYMYPWLVICQLFYTDVSPLLYIATGIISGQWLLYAEYEMLDHTPVLLHHLLSACIWFSVFPPFVYYLKVKTNSLKVFSYFNADIGLSLT